MKKWLLKIYWILKVQIGFDPIIFINSVRGLWPFIRDYYKFSNIFKGRVKFKPCLHDRYEEGGSTKDEYFWQDLVVSQMIFKKSPSVHIDIGSRLDGFVAHLASFRNVEVFDIRPLTSKIPGITYIQADLMSEQSKYFNYCDSLSCLHAIEHFGLGRYGDNIDIDGYKKGLASMAKILKKSGIFYLSTPIGVECVEFNANWIFSPLTIVREATVNCLHLVDFYVFDRINGYRPESITEDSLQKFSTVDYALGIFVFQKAGD